MKKLTYFEAFAGAAGMGLKLKKKKFRCVGFMENNPDASALLNYHYPETENFGDITRCNFKKLPNFNILLAGFPCLGFSTQGKMEGLKNKKSALTVNLLDMIDVKKPKFIILENVKNLLSKQMEKDFSYVINRLKKTGYSVHYRLVDASELGTLQQRVRVIIFAVHKKNFKFRESYFDDILQGRKQSKKLKKIINTDKRDYISWSKSTRKEHIDYRIREDGLINTLTSGTGCKGASTGTLVVENGLVRDLLINETEVLQGWPSDFTRYGLYPDGFKEIGLSARYRIVGNGVYPKMIVPFAEEAWNIANNI